MQFETSLLLLILLFFIILIVVHDAMMANYKSQVLFTSSQVGGPGVARDEYGLAVIGGNELPLGNGEDQVLPAFTLERGEQRMKMTGEFVLDVTISDIGGGTIGDGDIIQLAVIQDDQYEPSGAFHTLTKVTNYPVVFGEITTIRVPFTTEKEAWNRPQSIALVDKNLDITGFTTETGNSGVCVFRASYWYY